MESLCIQQRLSKGKTEEEIRNLDESLRKRGQHITWRMYAQGMQLGRGNKESCGSRLVNCSLAVT